MQRKMLGKLSCNVGNIFPTINVMPTLSTEEHRKIFGAWLKNQRVYAGLTQKELAEGAEITEMTIGRIEKGESGTKRDTAISIVDAINRKSKTGHKVIVAEALERLFGQWKAPSSNSVPKPILEALAREGTLSANDERLIAGFITRLKESALPNEELFPNMDKDNNPEEIEGNEERRTFEEYEEVRKKYGLKRHKLTKLQKELVEKYGYGFLIDHMERSHGSGNGVKSNS